MRYRDAKTELARYEISLRHADGEYRVNPMGASEDSAYYTDDLTDAYLTGLAMAGLIVVDTSV